MAICDCDECTNFLNTTDCDGGKTGVFSTTVRLGRIFKVSTTNNKCKKWVWLFSHFDCHDFDNLSASKCVVPF